MPDCKHYDREEINAYEPRDVRYIQCKTCGKVLDDWMAREVLKSR